MLSAALERDPAYCDDLHALPELVAQAIDLNRDAPRGLTKVTHTR